MIPDKVRLRRLAITNYRGVQSFKAEFPAGSDREVLVLSGGNGSGKTSVLEGALLAMNADRLLRPSAIGEQAVRAGADDFRIEAEIEAGGRHFSIERSSRRSGPKLPEPRVAYFSSWRAQRYIGAVPVTAGKPGRRPDPRNEENRLWITKQYLVNAKAHGLLREEKSGQRGANGRYTELVGRLNKVWSHFYPSQEATFRVDETSDDPEAGFDVFVGWKGQPPVTLDQLSSGQQEIVSMFGWLICEDLDGALIVVDEPELHLDRSWHRVVLRSLQEILPNSQFIVATHSPDVFDSVYSFQRLFFSQSGVGHVLAVERPAGEGERR